ncbi:MAG: hypothetical protein PV344_01515 [Anaplasma sp.]|nr:hypothetical protein [Anaplasma sp.]
MMSRENYVYCKRLNFRENLIFANFANRPRFAKNRSREQFGQYVNTTEDTIDSRKLDPANNSGNMSTLRKIQSIREN